MAAGVSTTTSSNCTNGGNTQNRGDYSCWEVKTQKVNFKNRLALVLSMDLHARFSFFGFFFFPSERCTRAPREISKVHDLAMDLYNIHM